MEEEIRYKIHSANEIPWKLCKKAEKIVIKIGTRALINEDRTFDKEFFRNLALDVSTLYMEGKEIIIISSGAVNAGVNELGLLERPRELISLQTMAAVGNPLLMNQYKKYFTFAPIAQILVTQEDISNRESYNNIRNTLKETLKRRIIPIINENDVVSVNEIRARKDLQLNFTDNDILGGLMCAVLKADILIMLSDIDGLYTKHPNSPYANFIPFIPTITDEIIAMAQAGSDLGRGGMVSKVLAAQIATYSGSCAIIADSKKSRIKDVIAGSAKCTFFSPRKMGLLKIREIWILFASINKGKIHIDEGAAKAIKNGASLLFNGIKKYKGIFNKGDIVEIYQIGSEKPKNNKTYIKNNKIARAIINYSFEELERFSIFSKTERKEYFLKNNIREIISHENMAFVKNELKE